MLLGLASIEWKRLLPVQYSLPVATVYRNAFLAVVSRTRRLDALRNCFLSAENPYQLPSWAPDWSLPLEEQLVFLSPTYMFSGMSCADFTLESTGILEVSGLHFSTVCTVKGPPPASDAQAVEAIKGWAPENIEAGKYPTGWSLLDAFAAAISLRNEERIASSAFNSTSEDLKRASLHELVQRGNSGDGEPAVALPLSPFVEYCRGQGFLTTHDGYFGLGPANTQPGK